MSALLRIARLSAAFLGSNLARGAIAFGLSLVVGRAFGVVRFGQWILCTTWASTLTVVADLGLGLLLTRDGSRVATSGLRVEGSSGSRAFNDFGSLVGGALVLRLTLVVPAALAMASGARWFSHDPETQAGLQAAAALGVVGAAYGCFGAAFRSQPAWVLPILAIETTWHAIQLVACWSVLHAFSAVSVSLLVGIAVAVQLLQLGTAWSFWRAAFGSERRIRIPPWRYTQQTLVRALPFALAGIVANLQTRLAPLMLGYLSTNGDLGAFAAAAKFGTTARLVPSAIFTGALPVLSREHDRQDDGARAAFAGFDRALLLLSIAIVVPGVLLARPLLQMMYGAAFAGAAPALVWIGIGLAPGLTNSAAKIALYAAGAERTATAWSAASLALQGAAGLLLIPSLGATGAAAAVAAGEAITWLPLRRASRAVRTPKQSSPRRAPAPTSEPLLTAAADATGRAAVR